MMDYQSIVENNEISFIFTQSGFEFKLTGKFVIVTRISNDIDYILTKSKIDQIFSTITKTYSDEQFSINRLVLDYTLYNIQDISYNDLLWKRLPYFEMDKEGRKFIYYANISYDKILNYVESNYLNMINKYDNR